MRRSFRLLLIVVAVFFAAAVVVFGPGNYFAYRRHKVTETLSLLRPPKNAIDEYARRHGEYPAARSFAALERVLGRTDASRDAWENVLRYKGGGSSFLLWSAGADGKDEQEPLMLRNFHYDEVENRGPKPFDLDLVVQDGIWAQYPEGAAYLCDTPPIKRVTPDEAANTGLLMIDLGESVHPGMDCPRFEILLGDRLVAANEVGDQQFRLLPGRYRVRLATKPGAWITHQEDADVVAGRITFVTIR
jgi:hypothetical protein